MHLKSLELQGYKTFAGRTTFELAERITCIVGPNGSGKSNIADAIRWVLGEQSYSLLRGKKTADMIFQGSEQRSRAGMASADIVFDNTSKWLPVDFSEVSISRRAYRDGGNEYILNGQKVRLKDITELLGNSGLSERTYTVIGQGLVDSALSLRAEERRRLFEEAAGIGLYRTRREEAQRRLLTTRRNLERVEDILSELKPRLRSLERQARRAMQYDQVKDDLQVLLRDWYGFHWHRAQQDLNEARRTARLQEEALRESRNKQSGLDQKITSFREHIQGVRARLSSWHRELSQLHAQREMITRELAVSDERVRSLIDQRQNASDELARLEQQAEVYRERLSESDAETQRLKTELDEAQSRVAAAKTAFEEHQAQRLEAERTIEAAQQKLADLSKQQTRNEARLAEFQAQIERQSGELEIADQAVLEADQALQIVETRLDEAGKAFDKASNEYFEANEALQAHRDQIAQLEGERKNKHDQSSALQTELARMSVQLEVLEQAEKALSGYDTGTRLLLKSAQEGEIGRAQGALSSHLHVPEELEGAIAAALGEYLDAVLLTEENSVENALEILTQEATRGVILPLDALVPSPPIKSRRASGVIGVASELVQAPPELRPAVDLLLGQTLVVDDRKNARDALAGQPEGAQAVTLRGEVYYANGPVMVRQTGTSSTLSRPRQRREIHSQIESTEKKIDSSLGLIKQLSEKLEKLDIEESEYSRALESLQREVDNADQTKREVMLEHSQAERQAEWQRQRQAVLQEEIQAGETEAGQISERLSALDGEIAQAQENLRGKQSTLSQYSLEEFQMEVSHWGTQAAVAEKALEDAKKRSDERRNTVEDAKTSLAGLQSRIDTFSTEIDALNTGKGTLRNQETEVIEKISALQALIDPAEEELTSSESNQDELLVSETEARNRLSAADRLHAQAQLALTRKQEDLDRLMERIEADFGLVSFEYAPHMSGLTPLPFDGMVQQLPVVVELPEGLDDTIKQQRAQLRRIGAVNPEAQKEYKEVNERFSFMTEQVDDLNQAEDDIKQVIAELDVMMEREFRITFDAVAAEFREIFTRLFGGGAAQLILTDPDNMTDTGIDIEARLPGRRSQGLSLLSGGERSLTATALVFSLLRVSPTPFCVLDEVDAMLDEANVGRFRDLLSELAQNTQFIVITHNRNTVQAADVIYGVTMGRDSASQVISLKLDEVATVV
ncbi:MAG: chromosome segregation protein SMC [Anaerolineales bacterium]|nr:chromosome segregation protein SMC [Chloroflexota bacterium]MBL6981710.1 chromosome segregation protein SMC [Anaerolineales bacterium]